MTSCTTQKAQIVALSNRSMKRCIRHSIAWVPTCSWLRQLTMMRARKIVTHQLAREATRPISATSLCSHSARSSINQLVMKNSMKKKCITSKRKLRKRARRKSRMSTTTVESKWYPKQILAQSWRNHQTSTARGRVRTICAPCWTWAHLLMQRSIETQVDQVNKTSHHHAREEVGRAERAHLQINLLVAVAIRGPLKGNRRKDHSFKAAVPLFSHSMSTSCRIQIQQTPKFSSQKDVCQQAWRLVYLRNKEVATERSSRNRDK